MNKRTALKAVLIILVLSITNPLVWASSNGIAYTSIDKHTKSIHRHHNVNDAPTIAGAPLTVITQNTPYSFVPTASDADGDTLTFSIINPPTWTHFDIRTGALTGTPDSTNTGTTRGIIISVSDGSTSALLTAFDLTVNAVVTASNLISWLPPTTYTDGSVLTDLAGYKIYYGTTEGNYTFVIDVNNIGITDYVIDNLTGPNTYYFTMTSYNSSGSESTFSNVIRKTIQ